MRFLIFYNLCFYFTFLYYPLSYFFFLINLEKYIEKKNIIININKRKKYAVEFKSEIDKYLIIFFFLELIIYFFLCIILYCFVNYLYTLKHKT